MVKLLNFRIAMPLLIGMLSSQTITSYSSLAVESQSTITARSCAGLGNSLTKDDIELRGARLGFSLDANTMGSAFEKFVLDSLQYPKNAKFYPSPIREAATLNSKDGPQKSVVPEAVGSVIVAEYDSSTFAITYIKSYAESSFTEVKFTSGAIYLSSFEHQVIGYIDIASRSLAGVAPSSLGVRRPTASVEFVTPSNATIALSVITTANQERVAIYQRIACDAPLTPSTTDMIAGARVLLNPEVFGASYPAVYKGGGIVSGLK